MRTGNFAHLSNIKRNLCQNYRETEPVQSIVIACANSPRNPPAKQKAHGISILLIKPR